MAFTIAVSNQKGGVGKTTTSVHLAAAFALAGHRTLLIDLDSQANATVGLGVAEATGDRFGSYRAIAGDDIVTPDWCTETGFPGLSVLPASLQLAGVDMELGDMAGATGRLASAIEGLTADFDRIVIDCPPSLGILSVNALAAADVVLTPLPPERFAIDGLARLQVTMQHLRASGRIHVTDPLILINRHQPWSEAHMARVMQLRNEYRHRVLVAEAPLSPALETASELRRPVYVDTPESAGGDACLYAAAELDLRLSGKAPGPETITRAVEAMKTEIARRYPHRQQTAAAREAIEHRHGSSWFARGFEAIRNRLALPHG